MTTRFMGTVVLTLVGLAAGAAGAQSFRVQCPTSTITHPVEASNNAEPAYTRPTTFTTTNVAHPEQGYLVPSNNVNGAIKCQQISGGDGYATMADGTQTYMFSFGPLSGLTDIANGLPGTSSRACSIPCTQVPWCPAIPPPPRIVLQRRRWAGFKPIHRTA